MNAISSPPINGQVDIKDPRIRVTFADVAMRIAHDGPMYGVLILVAVLAFNKQMDSIHAVIGSAIALQARSRPPELTKGIGGTLTLPIAFILTTTISHILIG